jgi:hypothetical protein
MGCTTFPWSTWTAKTSVPCCGAIESIAFAIGTATPWVDILENALLFGALSFVGLRTGLPAAIVMLLSFDLLSTCPPTPDLSAWYIGLVPIPLLAVAFIAI